MLGAQAGSRRARLRVSPERPGVVSEQGTRRLWGRGGRAYVPLLDATPPGSIEPRPILLEMSAEIRAASPSAGELLCNCCCPSTRPGPRSTWCLCPQKGDGDEEEPCCSKSLPACSGRSGAAGAGGPPSEEEDSDQEGLCVPWAGLPVHAGRSCPQVGLPPRQATSATGPGTLPVLRPLGCEVSMGRHSGV